MSERLSKPKPPAPPSEAKARKLAAEFLQLNGRRLAADRIQRSLSKEIEPIAEELRNYVHSMTTGSILRSVKIGSRKGYVLAIASKQKQPQWRAEFERVTSVQEAEKVKSKQPFADKLEVTEF